MFNSNRVGGYSNGIAPQISINEYSLSLQPLGNENEILLSAVLSKIYSKQISDGIQPQKAKVLF
ncbi:hypothetical protein [Chryseobacterium sp. MMS23-Vi53]|uniref:hypothetical protein n=1 Tax=Chryseobacterium sp. MMS23-Vi53 TaxID=3386644 RepID=UPI0039ED158B